MHYEEYPRKGPHFQATKEAPTSDSRPYELAVKLNSRTTMSRGASLATKELNLSRTLTRQ